MRGHMYRIHEKGSVHVCICMSKENYMYLYNRGPVQTLVHICTDIVYAHVYTCTYIDICTCTYICTDTNLFCGLPI